MGLEDVDKRSPRGQKRHQKTLPGLFCAPRSCTPTPPCPRGAVRILSLFQIRPGKTQDNHRKRSASKEQSTPAGGNLVCGLLARVGISRSPVLERKITSSPKQPVASHQCLPLRENQKQRWNGTNHTHHTPTYKPQKHSTRLMRRRDILDHSSRGAAAG